MPRGRQPLDLRGKQFGRLTAIGPTGQRRGASIVWSCVCSCGAQILVKSASLVTGNTKSCGCVNRERMKKLQAIDLAGKVFGRLEAVRATRGRRNGRILWVCRCTCGSEVLASSSELTQGDRTSCGCLRREKVSALKLHDLTGQEFGRLTVLERAKGTFKSVRWLCYCKCGKQKVVAAENLVKGNSKSCGCWQREETIRRSKTHGMSQSPEYQIYTHMNDSRGIEVCERWKRSFKNFFDDVGPRPQGAKLTRLNRERGFELENCHWRASHGMSRRSEYRVWWNMRLPGRGIKICDRWKNSFENFHSDMGLAPRGSRLWRVNENRGFEPSNCRWLTWKDVGTFRRFRVLARKQKLGLNVTISNTSEPRKRGRPPILNEDKRRFEIRKRCESAIPIFARDRERRAKGVGRSDREIELRKELKQKGWASEDFRGTYYESALTARSAKSAARYFIAGAEDLEYGTVEFYTKGL